MSNVIKGFFPNEILSNFYKWGLCLPLYSPIVRTRLAYVSYRQRIQHVDIRNEKLVEIEFWRPDRLGSVQ